MIRKLFSKMVSKILEDFRRNFFDEIFTHFPPKKSAPRKMSKEMSNFGTSFSGEMFGTLSVGTELSFVEHFCLSTFCPLVDSSLVSLGTGVP